MGNRQLSASVIAELGKPNVRPVQLFEATFGGQAIRLWSGIGALTWNGVTYQGNGTLLGVSSIREEDSVVANGFSVQIRGTDDELRSLVLNSSKHIDTGKVWLGFIRDSKEENLLPYSDDFLQDTSSGDDFTGWLYDRTTLSRASSHPVLAGRQAFLSQETSETGNHYVQGESANTVDGVAYWFTIFAKALGRDRIFLTFWSTGFPSTYGAGFRLDNGTTFNVNANLDDSFIQSYGNGWYRCGIKLTAVDDGNAGVILYHHNGSTTNYAGDTTKGVLIAGAQLSREDAHLRYVHTDGAIIEKTADTGVTLITDPYLIAQGELDVPTIVEQPQGSTISVTYESELLRLKERAPHRYNQGTQKLFFPSDLGFDAVGQLESWQGVVG